MKNKEKISLITIFLLLLSVALYEYNESVKLIPSQNGEDSEKALYKGISSERLKNMLEKDTKIILLDLRSKSDFLNGHIPGAKSLEFPKLDESLDSFNKDNLIVLYCESGPWSRLAYDKFIKNNFTNVRILVNGFVGWKWEINGPVSKNDS